MSPRGFRLDRSVGQAALVVLMVLAFAAILVSRLTGGPGAAAGVAGATGTPGPAASIAAASDEPGSTPPASGPVASGDATALPTDPGPTRPPVQTDEPTAGPSTYVIEAGDTLSGIAAEFGTTWQVLARINDIDDPGRLRVGQEIQLP